MAKYANTHNHASQYCGRLPRGEEGIITAKGANVILWV